MGEHQVAVVGAGPAGISTAVALKDAGVRPLLIERSDAVAASWRCRYDRLRLNTGRQFSHLPNRKYPKGTPTFPSRDQVVEHLERHAHEDGIDVRLASPVERIERDNGGWAVQTPEETIATRQVVVATGYEHAPNLPDLPGRDAFPGELIHSSDYRNPAPYKGKRVLVVGPGCSGMEIAHDLATGGAAKVWLAVRTPPHIIARQGPGGLPGDVIATPLYHAPLRFADTMARIGRKKEFGDLTEYGLPMPEEGMMTRSKRLGVAPAILDKEVIDTIKARQIEIVGCMTAFDGSQAVLADDTRLDPDAVICATGYQRGLEALVGHLGVLDERGRPTTLGPAPALPGLRFVGFLPRPSQIGYSAKVARRAAKQIARELR
ncbi:MAG TPA: NAD(P)/FAD-dependent oxidoreductase [Solirubrobacteraceae bacterium]